MKYISALLLTVFLFTGTGTDKAHAQEPAINTDLHEVRPLFKADTLSVCFLGDVMMHSEQIETARRSNGTYDFSSYFELIGKDIEDADIAVANMEFTLSGEPYTGYPCFSAPDSFAAYLADCGFDVFLAANNHILDKGSEGAARTADIYRSLEAEHGISFTGLAENEERRAENYPLFIRRKGITLALVNFTYGTNLGYTEHWPKTNYMGMKSEISKALLKAQEADFVIALPHWGPEYELRHSEMQEETAVWLTENGADLIIGAHPHVVQDTTSINDVPVVYSLGNAVSNMSAANTQLELMVTMKIARHGNGDLEMLPLQLKWLWCSRPGGFSKSYTVIPVKEYLGKEELWEGRWDYEKMAATFEKVKEQFR